MYIQDVLQKKCLIFEWFIVIIKREGKSQQPNQHGSRKLDRED